MQNSQGCIYEIHVVDWSIFFPIWICERSCIYNFVTFHQVPPVYGLDATDPYFWNERVLGPAFKIVESYLEGQKPDGVEPLPVTEQSVKNELKTKHCDICDRMFVGDIQWNDHLRSKKHRRMLKRKQVLWNRITLHHFFHENWQLLKSLQFVP
jgi:hypothetical protein